MEFRAGPCFTFLPPGGERGRVFPDETVYELSRLAWPCFVNPWVVTYPTLGNRHK